MKPAEGQQWMSACVWMHLLQPCHASLVTNVQLLQSWTGIRVTDRDKQAVWQDLV